MMLNEYESINNNNTDHNLIEQNYLTPYKGSILGGTLFCEESDVAPLIG